VSASLPPILVVAAIIERDGCVLIGQRKRGARHELEWEFPGGKVEEGEEPRAALARELREELGIEARIGPELARQEFHYPGAARRTQLRFYRVTEFAGEPRNLDFEQIVWAHPRVLPDYAFLAGDREVVAWLAARG
jgi:8-oxo-dGTP diphosphatase